MDKRDLILGMLEIGCIQISPKKPFTYTSGLKGPIYCDNRLIPTYPALRKLVAKGFSKIIDDNKLDYDLITGVATAGITHASFLAELRDEPMVYTRSKPKGYGQGKMVEGDAHQGQRLLLVEDLINQGSSIKQVIEGVRAQGFLVDSALSIVDYEMDIAINSMKSLNVKHFSLIKFSQLADMVLNENIIDSEGYELLLKWRENPQSWS